MFFSRHQLHEALLILDRGRLKPCPVPRRTDWREQWNIDGKFELASFPPEEFIMKGKKKLRTNGDPLPTPHGTAFFEVDPTTGEIRCAACHHAKKAK